MEKLEPLRVASETVKCYGSCGKFWWLVTQKIKPRIIPRYIVQGIDIGTKTSTCKHMLHNITIHNSQKAETAQMSTKGSIKQLV